MSVSSISTLTVKIKANIASTKFQLFWVTSTDGIAAIRSVSRDYTGNRDWQEISLDLSNNTNLQGKTIKGFRVDPTNDANVDFEIDCIRAKIATDPATSCNTASVEEFTEKNILVYPNPISKNV